MAFDPADPSLFFKMTGSGNDFIFVDGRSQPVDRWPADRIRAACDRRQGVGADGLVILSKEPDGAVRMAYFNADGSRAEMCGNAGLCAARLAPRLGLVAPGPFALETDSGRYDCRTVGDGWMAELKFPAAPAPGPRSLDLTSGERHAAFGTVGVPHLVVWVDDLERVDVLARGRALRFAPEFGPAGTNVNFVAPVGAEPGTFGIRTYERGVEDETLACGTGTVAAALALARAHDSPLPARLRSRGGLFLVSATLTDADATDVWLRGEGRLVYTGNIE